MRFLDTSLDPHLAADKKVVVEVRVKVDKKVVVEVRVMVVVPMLASYCLAPRGCSTWRYQMAVALRATHRSSNPKASMAALVMGCLCPKMHPLQRLQVATLRNAPK